MLPWATAPPALFGSMASPLIPPIYTRGAELIDSRGARVKLRCVNWYGLQMEQKKLLGPVPLIARRIANAGFNCVQLPFSTELVASNDTALIDGPVEELTGQGLAVILNSHTNRASWCCSFGDGNGLWNIKGNPSYTTETWLQSLETVARRYSTNKLVIGFDLKNEIHSTQDAQVTWGVSPDTDTDWKAASELAANRIHGVNPDSLIFVQGLCYALDARELYRKPPQFPLSGTKLVASVHAYPWSFIWTLVEVWVKSAWVVSALCFLAITSGAALFWMIPTIHKHLTAILAQAIVIGLLSISMGAGIVANVHRGVGCRLIEYDNLYLFTAVAAVASLLLYTTCAKNPHVARGMETNRLPRRTIVIAILLVVHPTFVGLFALSVLPNVRYSLIYSELRSRLVDDSYKVPVFLGEFGMDVAIGEHSSQYWAVIKDMIQNEEMMGWAYWPLNAFKREGEVETFGLLQGKDYAWLHRRLKALPWQ